MTWHQFEIQARLADGMGERRVHGGALQLVESLSLSDEQPGVVSDVLGAPAMRPRVLSYLRLSEARGLAFRLPAELAERRMEAEDEPA